MTIRRAILLAPLATPVLAMPALAQFALAQPPLAQTRPLRLIIPVGVAGVTDVVARILADAMGPLLGSPVVPDNLTGAGSTVGAAAFHRAAPDGNTLFIGTNNHPVMRAVYPNFPHDPITDFTPLALVGQQPFALAVHPGVPATNVPELLAWLRREGDRANYGAANPGATNHMAGEMLKQLSGAAFTVVPYRTAANAVQDLLAGRMQVTIDSPTLLQPLAADGRVRLLAVSSPGRSALLPGLPSLAEFLPGYNLTGWQILFARPGTPPEADATVRNAARLVLRDPTVRARLLAANVETWPDSSPAAAAAHLAAEVARWAPIVARMNIAG